MTRRPTYARGFTLAEVLVTMVLTTLIALLAYAWLHTAGLAWQRTGAMVARDQDIHLVERFLRDTFDQAVTSLPGIGGGPSILGSTRQIEFIAPLPREVGLSGLYRMRLEFMPGSGALYVDYRLLRPDVSFDTGKQVPHVLLSDIDDLKFDYVGTTDSARRWSQDWQLDEPPRLVRVRFRSEGGQPRSWVFELGKRPMIGRSG